MRIVWVTATLLGWTRHCMTALSLTEHEDVHAIRKVFRDEESGQTIT